MDRPQITQQVIDILSEMFELDRASLTPQTRLFEDLDLDSLDAIDMIARLQALTGKQLGKASLRKIRTIDDVVGVVQAHLEG